jgi:hypothetical protein
MIGSLGIVGFACKKVVSQLDDIKIDNLGKQVQSDVQPPVNIAQLYRGLEHDNVGQNGKT